MARDNKIKKRREEEEEEIEESEVEEEEEEVEEEEEEQEEEVEEEEEEEEDDDDEELIEEPEEDTIGTRLEKGLLVFFIILVYIALMALTGGTVFAAYGWQGLGAGPNGTLQSKTIGMTLTIINIMKGQKISFNTPQSIPNQLIPVNQTNITLIVTGVCPVKGICPPVSGCIEDKTSCLPQPKPPCTPQIWPARHYCPEPVTPCPPGSCPPFECPTTTTETPIENFRDAIIESKSVSEWINMYPPHSANRLEVVTTLMSHTSELFAVHGFFHRCEDRKHQYENLWETTCSFCHDRYNYIRCVMSNQLIGQKHTDKPWEFPSPLVWSTDFKAIHTDIVNTLYRTWPIRTLDYIFDRIEKMMRTFAVKTASGGECLLCTEFWRSIYNLCFSTYDKWYVFPQNRNLQRSLLNIVDGISEPDNDTIVAN